MTRAETRIVAGRRLRDRLRAEGRHMDAQAVEDLTLSLTAARTALRQLHADNTRLREAGHDEA